MDANVVDADAKIFSYQSTERRNWTRNIADIKEAITMAHQNYGIRIFNLQCPFVENFYNQDISTYAYT